MTSLSNPEDVVVDMAASVCNGCRRTIEEGSVVAFGDHIWHVECFRCAKCETLVDHDSNLLLLSDGNPICERCSYNCRVCNRRIDNLAIMTGDESYHADCFRCRLCQRKIEDLVFAKTSQGIYCMVCHNERISKSKKSRQSRSTAPSANLSRQTSLDDVTRQARNKNLPKPPPLQPPQFGSDDGSSISTFRGPEGFIPLTVDVPPAAKLPGIASAPVSSIADDRTQDYRSIMGRRLSFRDRERHRPAPLTVLDPGAPPVPALVGRKDDRSMATQTDLAQTNSGSDYGDQQRGPSSRDTNSTTMSFDSFVPILPPTPASARTSPEHDPPPELLMPPALDAAPSTPAADRTKSGPHHRLRQEQVPPAVPPRSVERPRAQTTSLAPAAVITPRAPQAHSRSGSATTTPRVMFDDDEPGPPPSSLAPQTPGPVKKSPMADDIARTTLLPPTHHASKSLESPIYTGFLGSINTPEAASDMSSAIGLGIGLTSPQMLQSPRDTTPGHGGATGLERSSTISKIANKMLRHRKSASGGTVASPGKLTSRRDSRRHGSQDLTWDRETLQNELQAKTDRVSNLEQTLGMTVQNRELELQIDTRKQMLANLETRLAQVKAETTSLLQHRHHISDLAIPLPEWQARVVHDLEASMQVTKDRTARDIENLLRQKRDLSGEVESLNAETERLTHDGDLLRQRNKELTGINENVVRTIQNGMTTASRTSDPPPPPPSLPVLKTHTPSSSVTMTPDIDKTPVAPQRELEFPAPMTTIPQITPANFSTLLHEPSYSSGNDTNAGEVVLGVALGHTASNTTSQLDTADEDDSSNYDGQSYQVNHEPALVAAAAAPKKFTWKKGGVLTKKAFRWARGTESISNIDAIGEPQPPLISSPGGGYAGSTIPTLSGMTGSRSQEKLPRGLGAFKRTWQSQGNLTSHLGSDDNLAPSNATSRTSTPSSMFGNSLVSQAALERRDVPELITTCIAALEGGCLDYEGLYRKSGGAMAIRALIDSFDAGDRPDAERLCADPAVTSSILKQYLRRLPQPLVPFERYEHVVATTAIPDDVVRLRALRDLLIDFRAPHRQTLRVVLRHLRRVADHSATNLMTPKNLAVVLGPSVMWDRSGAREIEDVQAKTAAVQFMIEHADEL